MLLVSYLFWSVFWMIACPIVAKAKGRDTWGWFFLGAFFGIFAFIILLCLPARRPYEYVTDGGYRAPVPAPPPVTVNINMGSAGEADEKRYSANDVARMMSALAQSGGAPEASMKVLNGPACKYGCGRSGANIRSLDGSYYHRECHTAAYRDGRV